MISLEERLGNEELLGLFFVDLGINMRSVGLHFRFSDSFEQILTKALEYQSDIIQSFFINAGGRYIAITPDLVSYFHARRDSFKALYAHSSYLINIADHTITYHPYLKKEITRSQRLGFSHLIFHPGAVTADATRERALDTVVRRINSIVREEPNITIVLENSGHGKKALGGDLQELYYIRERLDKPERVGFCLDTAHAHVFGYDLITGLNLWIELAHNLFGESIALIHLNDTAELQGSQIDRHCMIGRGQLGETVLKNLVQHPLMKAVPIILEPPVLSDEEERHCLELVKSWVTFS